MKLHLLPEPRRLRLTGGTFAPTGPVTIALDPAAASALAAARTLARAVRSEAGVPCRVRRGRGAGAIRLEAASSDARESYVLSIRRDGVRVTGDGLPGLFYGIQTLVQIVRQCGRRLPCLLIRDEPAFAHRGYYLDISRGKVPTLRRLKELIDRLAALKLNQLQLYVEHVFAFRFDPSIGAGCDPLTAADLRALDRCCRARHIELVPSLACFGHMGRVLSLPAYRGLAEIEWPAKDWRTSTWIQRLRGATINPRRPGSRRLLRRMLDEFLPAFSSSHFNLCGDETYDLGAGLKDRRPSRIAGLYLEHLRFLRGVARRYGKRLMFWGDVMLHHPRAIRDIPRDAVVLDWGYSPDTPFEKAGRFIRAGLETHVCPSTRGYRVVFNEVEEARGNISGYARAGRRLGASGLLTTDWGDMGHFNLLACSLHGLALGAAMGWNPASDEGAEFDRAFALQVFGDRSGDAARLFVRAGTTGLARWPLLLSPPGAQASDRAAARKALRLRGEVSSLPSAFGRLRGGYLVGPTDLDELRVAARALALNVERILLDHRPSARRARAYVSRLRRFADDYAGVWRRANRRSGLPELLAAFRRAAAAARSATP